MPLILDYIDYKTQKVIRNTKSVLLSTGTHTLSDAKTNGYYVCSQQEGGTLNGQVLTLNTGVNNAEVIYELATPTEESITLPSISTAKGGKSIFDILTKVEPSKLKITYKGE